MDLLITFMTKWIIKAYKPRIPNYMFYSHIVLQILNPIKTNDRIQALNTLHNMNSKPKGVLLLGTKLECPKEFH